MNLQLERSITMACSSLFSCNFTPISYKRPTKHLISLFPSLSSSSLQHEYRKREFPVPSVASIPSQPINVDYLKTEFSGHGVTFESIGDNYVTKMTLENRSTAILMLPSGLITSYKVPIWHGGTLELLQTSVSEGDNGAAVIEGGVSLALNLGSDGETSWSPSTWSLHDIRGNSQDSIQAELISSDTENMVEIRYIVSLHEDFLSSEIVVSNSKSSSIQLTGSVISNLTVSTPDATYAVGLEGSNFYTRPPFLSKFSITHDQEIVFSLDQFWSNTPFKGLVSGLGARNQKNADEAESEEELEGEENDNYKHLTEEMSRIYTSAPQFFTVIDRGRRNSVVIGREGFDELYMFSPGSRHEFYSKYAYICVGQSAMLKPIILGPGDVWRGGQQLHNPNL